jgi:hypothetical protein
MILIVCKIECFATPQTGDLLIIDNDTIRIFQYPLDTYFNKNYSYNPGFFDGDIGTYCWRGYKAVWIIKDNKLFLKDIYDCSLSQRISIDRVGLQKDDQGLIFAKWFNGSFKINLKKKEEIREPWNFGRLFMKKLTIRISGGQIIT